ncbi:MAG: hypothetical protein GY719_38935 [bacterium]|nr:hypothetical protein [bacterium]
MKIGRALQLLVNWEEVSAAVPEGSEDRERERRALETMVGETLALQDRLARESRPLLLRLHQFMNDYPECEWPPISGDGVQRECTIELAPMSVGPCLECAEEVGSGPIGWIGDPQPGPLCDRCLAEASPELAAILGLLSFLRQVTDVDQADDPQATSGLMEAMLMLTRSYAQSCAGAWPSRPKGMREMRDQALAMARKRHGKGWALRPPDGGEAH